MPHRKVLGRQTEVGSCCEMWDLPVREINRDVVMKKNEASCYMERSNKFYVYKSRVTLWENVDIMREEDTSEEEGEWSGEDKQEYT